jgi:hypothetical protein
VTGAPRSIVATCLAVVAAVAVVGLLIDRAREARPVIADIAELAEKPAGDPAPRRTPRRRGCWTPASTAWRSPTGPSAAGARSACAATRSTAAAR